MKDQQRKTHPRFRFVRRQMIDSLGIEMDEYEHIKTGAMHYHLDANNSENVFLVALRTVPTDSSGVAHILEHTALCGSERYPVRDPFFMMIRRSLNTFMNAFTSSDWTAYPFASQNRKDFDNLLDVYLDAVFFSRLDPLDFAQEGHRVEFKQPDDSSSDLVYKGVVFNEMKGAMSSPVSVLWQSLSKYLFPTTTYHYNSGGEPESIPDLSYKQLKAFYQTHYHPSNAIFMTFGDIPAEAHQARFEERVLSRFERMETRIEVRDEKRYHAPVRIEEAYALEDANGSKKTHTVLGWLLGRSIDLEEQLKAQLLSRVLLDNSASPLRYALETSELGQAPSPLCGLEESNREMSFVCGLEGSEPEQADAIEKRVMEVLQRVADQGVPQDQVEAALHQLELSQREIGGDSYPFGLQLILTSLSCAIHRGDPIALLNLDPVLDQLREEIKDRDFIPGMIRSYLLENPHRVRLTLRPDAELARNRDQEEAKRLAAIKAALSEQEKNLIVKQAQELAQRQCQQDDETILPKVTIDDIPEDFRIPEGDIRLESGLQQNFYAQGTNGLVYQQIIVNLPTLDETEQELLPYYSQYLTELGYGDLSYQQAQAKQSSVTGGIHAYATLKGSITDEQQVAGFFVLSGKALAHNQAELSTLLHDTFHKIRFDETGRIKELIAEQRARKEQSITGNGHGLAMTAAASLLSPAVELQHRQRGLLSIVKIKKLDESLNDEAVLTRFAGSLKALHQRLLKAPRQFLTVAEGERQKELQKQLESLWQVPVTGDNFKPFQLPSTRSLVKQIWTTSTQVNFCAKAYPTVVVEHPDAAPLSILGDFLRNGYLHRTIREQGGAYGGGASQDSSNATFRFFSYRDPRLSETLKDFDRSIDWLLEEEHLESRLEEAILGVISSIDKPGSPSGEAKQAFHSTLFGRTPEQRRAFRSRILGVTLNDLKRVAKTYLKNQEASVSVITDATTAKDFEAQGYDIIDI